jgi:chromosome partitioning protein
MGPVLRSWRDAWRDRRAKVPDKTIVLPPGEMRPVGYIVMRHSVTAERPARAYSRWISRMPGQYREYVLNESDGYEIEAAADPNCIARLKDYRSLMPMAQEVRKPMFLLRPADGAFGGHQQAVQSC